MPLPRFAASQSLHGVGQVYLCSHRPSSSLADAWSLLSRRTTMDFGSLADISSKVCQGHGFPEGLYTLQVIHHVIPQPSTTS